ncbi:Immediate early protein ICP0 [Corallococcus sp. H22C18031201]|uniref:Immediate early protein ICP0 n=1 Tax=Citreicoccus inhibens TaxID=2849499 RepID=UPI000E7354E0|nr:Immediate early protein ICP0 [Citreicoccus inhibens]MBU8899684.1 Immediate early protein ICP0 [Citreicoccus inhibens]RJS18392.1 Immediate early protein ICP0 [Corallococcus sp. H22C18031201]
MSSRISEGTRGVRVSPPGESPATPRPRGGGAPMPEPQPVADGFLSKSGTSGARPALGATAREPVLDVRELLPPGLEGLEGQESLAGRFASDSALLAPRLSPASLPSSERVARLWSFFAAYAEAAAAHPPQDEARAAFREALDDQGFATFHDADTGQDGVTAALWVLDADSPEEARQRAETVRLEPPPEVLRSEAAFVPQKEAPPREEPARERPAVEQRGPERFEPPGLTAGQLAAANLARGLGASVPLERRDRFDASPSPADPSARQGSARKLGGPMLWNVLHRFRAGPEEDGAVTQARWERMAFGAMLALVGIALVAVALISSL